MEIKSIEYFFLNALLKISMAGLALILLSNLLLLPEDVTSIAIAFSILAAAVISYLLRQKYPTLSVIIISSIALAAMCYQRLTVPQTSTTLTVVLIVGFIFSVMLKEKVMWIMHGIAFLILNTVFVWHLPDAITAAITYSTLYFVLTYATWKLKSSYDRIYKNLSSTNSQLVEKANEITRQNKKLLEIQEDLNTLNTDLEKIVDDRTAKIKLQNELLIKYSYTNAHHLRGPVARLLGLASIYKVDPTLDVHDIINKMVMQANEIDVVVKKINIELESI